MATEENPHAGQGPVILDIGGDIGALIVEMPSHMEDLEVEIIPSGTDTRESVEGVLQAVEGTDRSHSHPHDADQHDHSHEPHTHEPHSHDHDHEHTHDHDHDHADGAPPHVAVVARPTPAGRIVHSLVYSELHDGTYDLYVRPHGPIRLTATVIGGEVTHTRWPDWDLPN